MTLPAQNYLHIHVKFQTSAVFGERGFATFEDFWKIVPISNVEDLDEMFHRISKRRLVISLPSPLLCLKEEDISMEIGLSIHLDTTKKDQGSSLELAFQRFLSLLQKSQRVDSIFTSVKQKENNHVRFEWIQKVLC